VADAVKWILDPIETIYTWIIEAIDKLINRVEITVKFGKDFPQTMKKFFSDLLEKFHRIF
jgi:hypothetical protein